MRSMVKFSFVGLIVVSISLAVLIVSDSVGHVATALFAFVDGVVWSIVVREIANTNWLFGGGRQR